MSQRMLAIIALLAFVVLVMGVLLTGGKLGLADAALAHFLPDRHRHHRGRLFSGRPGHGRPDQPSSGRGPLRHGHGVWARPASCCRRAPVVGGADNMRAVNGGLVDSGFADGDVLAAAVAGQGPSAAQPPICG